MSDVHVSACPAITVGQSFLLRIPFTGAASALVHFMRISFRGRLVPFFNVEVSEEVLKELWSSSGKISKT